MKKKTSVAILVTAMSLLLAGAFVAWAGVGPSPFRVTLQNNSHIIDPGEQMYNKTMNEGVWDFYYQHGEMPRTLWATQAYPAVAPGQQASVTQWEPVGVCAGTCHGAREPNEQGILSVRHEGSIDVYNMYSFAPGTTEVAEEPDGAPFFQYPAECEPLGEVKCGECHTPNVPSHPIFAFASPGVMVGTLHVESAEEISVSVDIRPAKFKLPQDIVDLEGILPLFPARYLL